MNERIMERSDRRGRGSDRARHTETRSSDRVRRAWILMLCFLVPLLVMITVMIAFEVQPFGNRSLMIIDALHQYMPFYSVLYDKIRGGESLFYSWRAGLGVNFLSLMAYYLMSPLNLLIVFFKRSQLNMIMSMILVLKVALCGLTMGIYCNAKSSRANPFAVAAAAAYALNSYMVGYSWNVMWLDSIMMLPLILLGIERLVNQNKGGLYCLTLCYALFCNYYIGYMICIFSVIWFLLGRFESPGHFLKRGLYFAFCSLSAGGMSALILLPAWLGIRKTSAGMKFHFPKGDWLTTVPEMLYRQINMLKPISHDNDFDGNLNAYVGIFVLVFLFLYLLNRNIRLSDKIRRILVLGFFYLSFTETHLNYIWHGFHSQYGIPNRFSFLMGFVLIACAFEVMENLEFVRVWQVLISALCCGGIIAFILLKGGGEESEIVLILAGTLMIIYIFLLLIYSVVSTTGLKELLHRWHGEEWRYACCLILTIVVVAEMAASGVKGYYENGQINVPKFYSWTEDMEEATRISDDGTFYRSEVVWARMLDEAIYYPMNTVGLFGSTATDTMVSAMDDLGFATGANEYKYVGENVLTNYLLNVRYQYYKQDDEVFTEFHYRDTYGRVNLFENPIDTDPGYFVSPNIERYFDSVSAYPFRAMNSLAEAAFEIPELYKDVEIPDPGVEGCSVRPTGSPGEYRFEFKESKEDNLVFDIPVKNGAEDLYVYYDGTQVSKATVSLNGKNLVSGDYEGKMVSCKNAPADSVLSVKMTLKGDEKNGVIRLSAASLDADAMSLIKDVRKENRFTVTKYSDASLEGKARVAPGQHGKQLLFLSIPYDDGWTITVDGKKTDPVSIGKAFLGIKLSGGVHKIRMTYLSPGFRIGCVISIISLILFILFHGIRKIYWRVRKRNERMQRKKEAAKRNDFLESGIRETTTE